MSRVEFIKESELVFHCLDRGLKLFQRKVDDQGPCSLLSPLPGKACSQASFVHGIRSTVIVTSHWDVQDTNTDMNISATSFQRRPVVFVFIIILSRFHQRNTELHPQNQRSMMTGWGCRRDPTVAWGHSLRGSCVNPMTQQESESKKDSVRFSGSFLIGRRLYLAASTR